MQANVNHFQPLLDRCQVAIPIFHSYAHNALCQHRFSPRNAEGFGLTDGENVERLWSFLGRFAKMSKEMSPSNRIDLLSNALMHYCSLKAYTMGVFVYLMLLHYAVKYIVYVFPRKVFR